MSLAGFKLLFGLFVIIFGFSLLIFGPSYFRKRKMKKALEGSLPLLFKEKLADSFPLYKKLPPSIQCDLEQKINVFMSVKEFIGYKNDKVDDDVRLAISAQASLLLLNDNSDYFHQIKRIYVYPREMISKETGKPLSGYLETKGGRTSIIGEVNSSEVRAVVLAWNIVKNDIARDDGENLVIRLFAAALDLENPFISAAPNLEGDISYQDWDKLLTNYVGSSAVVSDSVNTNSPTYGSRVDAFSTITVQFFQLPHDLHQGFPELFNMLIAYYKVDPRQWR